MFEETVINLENGNEFKIKTKESSTKAAIYVKNAWLNGLQLDRNFISITDILAVLYNDIMKVYPKSPNHPERDIFILSKGHACVSVYAVLGLKGFFKIEDLEHYGQDNSKFILTK